MYLHHTPKAFSLPLVIVQLCLYSVLHAAALISPVSLQLAFILQECLSSLNLHYILCICVPDLVITSIAWCQYPSEPPTPLTDLYPIKFIMQSVIVFHQLSLIWQAINRKIKYYIKDIFSSYHFELIYRIYLLTYRL